MCTAAYNNGSVPGEGSSCLPELRQLPDEQLCALSARSGLAMEELVRRHRQLVRVCARPYFLAGADADDVMQEGMLALLHAAATYDASRAASFRTYASLCIRSRLVSAVRSSWSSKHRALNDSVPLYAFSLEPATDEVPTHPTEKSPEELLIGREEFEEFRRQLAGALSPLERQVLALYLEGLSYREIAQQLHRSAKAVDNAVQRIRQKAARLQAPASTA